MGASQGFVLFITFHVIKSPIIQIRLRESIIKELKMSEQRAKDSIQSKKSESKVTRSVVHTFPRPLFSD